MKLECYSGWDKLPDSANALFEQAEKESVFLSRTWFENVSIAEKDEDQSIVLACVVAGHEVKAILPLTKNEGNTWYSLKHKYSPLFSMQLSDDGQQQVLTCLAQGLSKLPLSGLILEPVSSDDGIIDSLQQFMESAGFRCERFFRHYNWVYHLQGQSFDDYMAARPARLRNTIARKQRKLKREHDYEIRLFNGEEVPQAMPDYYAVYSASWKSNEQLVGFVDGIVADFSKAGWTRLAVLYIDGQPAAAQLWFVQQGKASIFRLAYDEAWKQYSPGSILTCFLMEQVIENDEVKEIDFLTGNDAYKQDWMSERKECFAVCCVKDSKPGSWPEWVVESLKRILRPGVARSNS